MTKKDRLISKKWATGLVALACTLFLFVFVQTEVTQKGTHLNSQTTSADSVETISNVPLEIGKHSDDLFVSGLPDTVTVRLTGSRNLLNQIGADSFRVSTEDLSQISPGARTIRLVTTGLPEGVRYQVTPSQVFVQVGQRQTVTVPVQYEVAPEVAASGYYVSQVILDPTHVTLSGQEAVIDQLSQAKIKITSDQPQDQTFTSDYKLQLLDDQGNLLDLHTDATDILASVEIERNAKSVDINLIPVHEDTKTYDYRYRFVTSSSLVLHGSSKLLESIDHIDVHLDVQDLKETQTITGQVDLPEGITSESEEVEVEVIVEKR